MNSKNLKNKSILVFTGGGLAPGLNALLYGVVKEAKKEGAKIFGGLFGWHCLSKDGKIVDLDKIFGWARSDCRSPKGGGALFGCNKINLEPIKSAGGAILRSSRVNPYKFKNGINELKEKIKKHSLDYLVAIGGNDTLGAAWRLYQGCHLPIVGLPKTIDNDLAGTYWSPGFPSAAFRLIHLVKEIKREAAYSLARIFIIESMGAHAGWLTASASMGGADVIIPPEKYIDLDRVLKLTAERYKKNGNFAVVVMSNQAQLGDKIEGVTDDQTDHYGIIRHELKSQNLKREIKEKLKIDTKIIIPANYLESGSPIKIDREFAIKLGRKAIHLIKQNKIGFMPCLVRKNSKISVSEITLNKVTGKDNYRRLDETYFDFKNLKVKQKFLDYLKPILGKFDQKDKYNQLVKKIINFGKI